MSTKTKHTPGPWKLKRSGTISDNNGELVATTGYRVAVYSEEDDANARLIAAAPELLSAGEWMLALIDGKEQMPKPGDEVAEALRAAIAKARGEG